MNQFKLMTYEDKTITKKNFERFTNNEHYGIMMLLNGDILLINNKMKSE